MRGESHKYMRTLCGKNQAVFSYVYENCSHMYMGKHHLLIHIWVIFLCVYRFILEPKKLKAKYLLPFQLVAKSSKLILLCFFHFADAAAANLNKWLVPDAVFRARRGCCSCCRLARRRFGKTLISSDKWDEIQMLLLLPGRLHLQPSCAQLPLYWCVPVAQDRHRGCSGRCS